MLVFIDESGIHKSTDHTCVALVYIAIENYTHFEQSILDIEKSLGLEAFHWAHTVWRVKEQFLDNVLQLDFAAKIAILRNPAKLEENLETILAHMVVEKRVVHIYVDGEKPKWYERRVKKVLRDKGVGVKKLRMVKDSQYAGIRVADMVAGLARSMADDKNTQRLKPYFKRLQKKIIFTVNI